MQNLKHTKRDEQKKKAKTSHYNKMKYRKHRLKIKAEYHKRTQEDKIAFAKKMIDDFQSLLPRFIKFLSNAQAKAILK